MKALTGTLIQAFAAVAFAAAIPVLATAAPTVEKLPRVVITGKAVKPLHQVALVQQLPRVIVTGYRSTQLSLNTATDLVASNKA